MAVDYLHRLLVAGPRAEVRAFRRRAHREYPRRVAGRTWTEIVPFSFESLYAIAPAVRRVQPEIPCDPYELCAWPVRILDRRRAETRYQFQTRNLELLPLLRPLARALPALTFTFTTWCLDDASVEGYRVSGRRTGRWLVPGRRRDLHWARARTTFGLTGDDVYDDEEADGWVREELLADALHHWDEAGRVRRGRPARRHEWWNRDPLRDLDTERTLAMLAVAEQEARAGLETPPRAGTPRGATRAHVRPGRASSSR